MSWRERSPVSRFAGPAAALALAGLLAGCFEPLYGDKTLTGGSGLHERMSSVTVDQIIAPRGTPTARLAVELQNDLIFGLNGGSSQVGKTHVLKVQISTQVQQIIVDIHTARPDVQQFGITATYSLIEVATNKSVVTGQTFSRVSFDNPGQAQRYANARGQRDAENRAAQVISDSIKSRLASYFAAGA
jgi:LPS-assembly lipoprotein